ncbi:MAG: hypothetical protein QOF21_2747 [Actinomycetota bacterium]|jgi:hypothetical protein
MSYAFIQDVPANAEIYGQIRGKLGDDAPKGLVSHVVITQPEGLRYIDVWETKADWESFRVAKVLPAVAEVLAGYGIAHDASDAVVEEIDVIDAWTAA